MTGERTIVADRGAAEPISLGAALMAGKKVPPDALRLLEMDHMEARAFFQRCLMADSPPQKRTVALRLVQLLRVHMAVEEELVYPAAAQATGDQEMVEHARSEHDQGRLLMDRIAAGAENLDAIVTELQAVIEQHVSEEEDRFFPRMRQAGGIDFHELGRRVAARRLELMLQLTDKPLMEGAMQQPSEQSVMAAVNADGETDLQPVDPQEARVLFAAGLRNAHATASQCRTMVERQTQRLEHYPKLKARLERHLNEKDAQLERLETALAAVDESPSTLKDAAMSMSANMGAMGAAMADDEIIKNSFTNAAMAQFEISAYKSLLIMGQAAGVTDALRPLQQSLSEERAMAAWLEENLPGTIIAHMQLRSAGEHAKR